MMHGYNHNTDDKAQLINDNLDIVKKIAFFYVGRVGKVCLLYTSDAADE